MSNIKNGPHTDMYSNLFCNMKGKKFTMPKETLDASELNNIVKDTIESLENGKVQIFEISEQALDEYNDLGRKFQSIQNEVKKVINEMDVLEDVERNARKELMLISKNFHIHSEHDIKDAYEKVRDVQIKLALKSEQEKQLISRRTEIEHQIRNMENIVKRSEYLASQVGLAMNYLAGCLHNVFDTIENLQQKEMLGAKVIMAQEEERQRISGDIHDGPAQSLTNIVIKCEVCEKLFDIDPQRTKMEIGNLKKLARSSLKEIREIIFDLRPMSLDDLGLIPTLEQYTARFMGNTGIDIALNLYERHTYIDPVVEVAVFRIIQEALNNIKKHSQANRCDIKLSIEDDMLFGKIIDNGVGFNMQDLKKPDRPLDCDSGFGIYNMKQRAELLNGQLTLKSKQNQGTTISLQIPISTENDFVKEEYNGENKGHDC